MNEQDKERFEEIKYSVDNGHIPSQRVLMWLCSKMEETEAKLTNIKELHSLEVEQHARQCGITSDAHKELTKVKAQRDRLTYLLQQAAVHLTHHPKEVPCLAHEVEKALAELEKS